MHRSRYAKFVPAGWLVFLSLFGGASRYDEWQQVLVAVSSTGLLLAALWTPVCADLRAKRTLWLFLAAVAMAIAIQLVPLPPSIWLHLPGREPFVPSATLTGLDQAWRPLSLTPDLTWAALFSLLPLAATLAVAPTAQSPALRPLIWTLIGVFTTTTVFGLLQTLGVERLAFYQHTNVDSAVGVFANRNHNAIFLSLAFPMVGYLLAVRRRRNMRSRASVDLGSDLVGIAAALCASVLYAVAIVQAGSRAGLLLGGLTLCATMAATLIDYRSTFARAGASRVRNGLARRSQLIAGGLLASLAVIIGLMALVARSVAFGRLVQFDVAEDYRARILPLLGEMAREFAPFGSGYGSFATVFRHYEPFDTLRFTYFNQAHNDVLQILIEGGFFGAALLIAAVIGWGWRAVGVLRGQRTTEPMIALAGSLLIAILFLSSFADYPLRTPLLAGILIFAGTWMLPSRPASPPDEP